MIPARRLRIQEAQTAAMAAATPAEVTQVVATPEAVVVTRVVATQVVAIREGGTPEEEDPAGDQMMAGGTR
jgi:hypothetical protein